MYFDFFSRRMMRTTKVGSKLNARELYFAAKTMGNTKKLDPEVVNSVLEIQVPQAGYRLKTCFIDWINRILNI